MLIPAPKAHAIIDGLSPDEYNNILVTLPYEENNQMLMKNTKLLRGKTLEKEIDSLKKCKEEILECKADNIKDQTPDDRLVLFMSAFDLELDIDLESRLKKISKMHDIYCVNTGHELKEKW